MQFVTFGFEYVTHLGWLDRTKAESAVNQIRNVSLPNPLATDELKYWHCDLHSWSPRIRQNMRFPIYILPSPATAWGNEKRDYLQLYIKKNPQISIRRLNNIRITQQTPWCSAYFTRDLVRRYSVSKDIPCFLTTQRPWILTILHHCVHFM
jgi:hypothetical protein